MNYFGSGAVEPEPKLLSTAQAAGSAIRIGPLVQFPHGRSNQVRYLPFYCFKHRSEKELSLFPETKVVFISAHVSKILPVFLTRRYW